MTHSSSVQRDFWQLKTYPQLVAIIIRRILFSYVRLCQFWQVERGRNRRGLFYFYCFIAFVLLAKSLRQQPVHVRSFVRSFQPWPTFGTVVFAEVNARLKAASVTGSPVTSQNRVSHQAAAPPNCRPPLSTEAHPTPPLESEMVCYLTVHCYEKCKKPVVMMVVRWWDSNKLRGWLDPFHCTRIHVYVVFFTFQCGKTVFALRFYELAWVKYVFVKHYSAWHKNLIMLNVKRNGGTNFLLVQDLFYCRVWRKKLRSAPAYWPEIFVGKLWFLRHKAPENQNF